MTQANKKIRRIFVTGTNTGVGKTVVTRALVRAYSNRGLRVRALKPVESGTIQENGERVPQDAVALRAAAGDRDRLDDICAYAFASPVSPHLAAAREQIAIETKRLLVFLEEDSHRDVDLVVVEGAGGFLVPLSNELLLGDLVAKTGMPLVVVAPDALGTINSVLLTLEAARRRKIPILGVILNRSTDVDFDNAGAIAGHGEAPILGSFPEVDRVLLDDDDALAGIAESALDLQQLLER